MNRLISLFTKLTCLVVCSGMIGTARAQSPLHASQWIFGKEAWVDFSADTPVVRRAPGFYAGEPSTSYSDSAGSLIWYSDAHAMYNRNHQVMLHGVLYDTLLKPNTSNTQGALALSDPGRSDRSYVLFVGGDYAVIDHNLNGGLGDVVGPPYLRNWHVSGPPIGTSEKLHAVRHANGQDWWILTLLSDGWPDTLRAPRLGVSLLDSSGPHAIHEVDLGLPASTASKWLAGEIKASADGSQFVFSGLVEQGVRLYPFDRCTGLPGTAIDSVFLDGWGYSLEFSPSGEIIYIGSGSKLWQWTPNSGQFDTSLYLIATVPPIYWFSGIEMALNDILYVATGQIFYPDNPAFSLTSLNTHLSVVHFPNMMGSACTFSPLDLFLDSGFVTWGLPNFANYALGALEGSPCDTLSGGSTAVEMPSSKADVFVFPNPAVEAWWLEGLEAGAYRYVVYDAFGREAARGEWRAGEAHRIPANGLPHGWYGLRIEQNGRLVWRGGALRR